MLLIYIIIGSLLASFIMLRVILIRKGGYSFPWLQFYIRGKEERFRLYEINNLQRLVVNTKLRDPLSIYWSKKAVVACLTSIDKQYKDDGTLEHPHEARFMRKLYELLNKIIHTSQNRKRGLQSTRDIEPHTNIEIFHNSFGHKSEIVEVHPHYLAIAHPRALNPSDTIYLPRESTLIVHFWRVGDSGYQFQSHIIGESKTEQRLILHVQHTRKLTRTQARHTVRKELNITARISLFQDMADSNDAYNESEGFKCHIVDISENGALVVIGGRVSKDYIFKVQSDISHLHIVMIARLLNSDYNKDKNLSLLRLRSVHQSVVMKNRISALVHAINLESP